MTLTFGTAMTTGNQIPAHAIISARQLASFRRFLLQEQVRTGVAMIEPAAADGGDLADAFEARVCPIALAVFARLFDYDAGVIGIIEMAQFERCHLTIFRIGGDGDFAMTVSFKSDERDHANP